MAAHDAFLLLAGLPEPVLPWGDAFEPPTGIHALQLRAVAHLVVLDSGVPSSYTTNELLPDGTIGEVAMVLGICQAAAMAMEGKLNTGLVVAERTVAKAVAGGWMAWELAARASTSIIHLLRRDRIVLAVAASRFQE
jgi:hypothetical protein